MSDRYLVVGYTAKDGSSEFTAAHGFILNSKEKVPPYSEIRCVCLSWANRNGGNFSFFQMNFMTFLSEDDYRSFVSK